MGWLMTYGATRRDVIREIKSFDGFQKGTAKGNHFWTVFERTSTDGTRHRFVVLYLLRGSAEDGWGYKGVSEDMGPYADGCPVSYLDGLTDPINECSEKFRERVRAVHQHKKRALRYAKSLKPGSVLTVYGKDYRYSHRRGQRVVAFLGYTPYGIRPGQITVPVDFV